MQFQLSQLLKVVGHRFSLWQLLVSAGPAATALALVVNNDAKHTFHEAKLL